LHQEIKIKTDFGHIAAQAWGTPKNQPILAVHGWLDNSASFEILSSKLLEKLPFNQKKGHRSSKKIQHRRYRSKKTKF